VLAVVTNDDDMVEFLKSLGLKGAVGFLELSITGVPLLHVVAAGIHRLFVHCDFTIECNEVVIVRPLSTVGYTSVVASVIHSRQ